MCLETRCIFVIYMQIKLDISVCKIHRLFTIIEHQLQVHRTQICEALQAVHSNAKFEKFGIALDIRNVCINEKKNEYFSTPRYHLDLVGCYQNLLLFLFMDQLAHSENSSASFTPDRSDLSFEMS